MRPLSVFAESFLDGFTMSGFLTRRQQPGSPMGLFAPEPGLQVTISPTPAQADRIIVTGDLESIPRPALRTMINLLKREEDRRATHDVDEAVHGVAR